MSDPDDRKQQIPDDPNFTFHVSSSMELRNLLRSGLVKAQGRDTDKIPLYVSWPEWLEDGIVCLYARDLHAIVCNTIQETVKSISVVADNPEELLAEENNDEKPTLDVKKGVLPKIPVKRKQKDKEVKPAAFKDFSQEESPFASEPSDKPDDDTEKTVGGPPLDKTQADMDFEDPRVRTKPAEEEKEMEGQDLADKLFEELLKQQSKEE